MAAIVVVAVGLGPFDHQLLWLHLGSSGHDDWRSHSLSPEACLKIHGAPLG